MKKAIITEEQIRLVEDHSEMNAYLEQIRNMITSGSIDNFKTGMEILKGLEEELRAGLGSYFSAAGFLRGVFGRLADICHYDIPFRSGTNDEIEEALIFMLSERKIYMTEGKLKNSDIPPAIGGFFYLQSLYLGGNYLEYIPKEIFKISSLETLGLQGNLLSDVPEDILELGNLKKLDISENNIRHLPPVLEKMHNLKELYLQRNFFDQVTQEDLEALEQTLKNCHIEY